MRVFGAPNEHPSGTLTTMGTYFNGATTVQPGTPTQICTVPAVSSGVMIQNAGSAAVFVGGLNVTTNGSNQGLSIVPGAIITLPSVGGIKNTIYGITEAVPQTVVFLTPQSP